MQEANNEKHIMPCSRPFISNMFPLEVFLFLVWSFSVLQRMLILIVSVDSSCVLAIQPSGFTKSCSVGEGMLMGSGVTHCESFSHEFGMISW